MSDEYNVSIVKYENGLDFSIHSPTTYHRGDIPYVTSDEVIDIIGGIEELARKNMTADSQINKLEIKISRKR